MTSRERNDILFCGQEFPDFFTITNSRDLNNSSDDPNYPGLQVRADEYYAEERLIEFVRRADIDILENCFYLDEGLFRMMLINAFLGKDTAGWKITEIAIGGYWLSLFLQNPALQDLNSGSAFETLREFKELGAKHEYSDDVDKFFAALLMPASQVFARWVLPLKPDACPECNYDFHFTVQAPKPSGKYPKRKRTAIHFYNGVWVTEISKKHRHEVHLLRRTPEQEAHHEQPICTTDTYYA